MKFDYVTPARGIYYAAIAISALIVKAIAEPIAGEQGATAAIVLLMWLLLVIDLKILPSKFSLIQPFLPGVDWLDLGIALPIYAGLALVAYKANPSATSREFIVAFLSAMAVCAVFGVFALLRWRRWRGQRHEP